MDVNIQGTTTTTRNKAMAYLRGLMVASIMEPGSMGSRKELEYTRMRTTLSSSGCGKTARGSNGSRKKSTRTMSAKQTIINDGF
jgi:hypothetical protein